MSDQPQVAGAAHPAGAEAGAATSDDPYERARACASALWAEDRASQSLGMRLVEVGPGTATVAMTVRGDMVNGHGLAHGGFVFALADSAFAFACNSHGERTVAYVCAITYLAPAREGDELTAVAAERSRSGRTGTYDVTVKGGGHVVAEFRGTGRTTGGTVSGQAGRPAGDQERLRRR